MSETRKDSPSHAPARRRGAVWLAMPVLAALIAPALHARSGAAEPGLPEGSARRILSEADQEPFAAVGQIRTTPHGLHCTATLVAPDLVLTAAHCMASHEKAWVAVPYRAVFWPDYRDGRRGASEIGAALAIGEGYVETGHISGDLALLRLKAPIPADVATPIPVAEEPLLRGRELATFSYGYDASFALAEESPCHALAALDGAVVTSCEAVGGMSGSPVIARDDAGEPRVAAVISSRMSRAGGQPGPGRAVVVPVDAARLAALAAGLSAAPGGG
ncbi:serine protease [Mangrovicoccus sp. HB161399]|uniref:trypsin-like serine peptidase n=1 Tax=Mangrovicoccus sp. HB161399 TaxID=2720392 RepID=UPI0015520AD8|nr:trypsin-like peptidase domain-containing protein [Mangrovicoccus sp. HB161399]